MLERCDACEPYQPRADQPTSTSADTYADDLPYWNLAYGKPLLMIPYTLDNNDMRFAQVAMLTMRGGLPAGLALFVVCGVGEV